MASQSGGSDNGDLIVATKLPATPQTPTSSKSDNQTGDEFKMSPSSHTEDSVDSLSKELERLKLRLEEERKKLNDVSCMFSFLHALLIDSITSNKSSIYFLF